MKSLSAKAATAPVFTLLTANPLMYMSVPPTQKLSSFEAVEVVESDGSVEAPDVVSALHSQWQEGVMSAQFSVISSVQQGSASAVTHWDWD